MQLIWTVISLLNKRSASTEYFPLKLFQQFRLSVAQLLSDCARNSINADRNTSNVSGKYASAANLLSALGKWQVKFFENQLAQKSWQNKSNMLPSKHVKIVSLNGFLGHHFDQIINFAIWYATDQISAIWFAAADLVSEHFIGKPQQKMIQQSEFEAEKPDANYWKCIFGAIYSRHASRQVSSVEFCCANKSREKNSKCFAVSISSMRCLKIFATSALIGVGKLSNKFRDKSVLNSYENIIWQQLGDAVI